MQNKPYFFFGNWFPKGGEGGGIRHLGKIPKKILFFGGGSIPYPGQISGNIQGVFWPCIRQYTGCFLAMHQAIWENIRQPWENNHADSAKYKISSKFSADLAKCHLILAKYQASLAKYQATSTKYRATSANIK